jgi:hypothetical protein
MPTTPDPNQILRESERLAEVKDPDTTSLAVEALEQLERCHDTSSQLELLYALPESAVRALAWRALTMLAVERANQDKLYAALDSQEWVASYQAVSTDSRVADAGPSDRIRWTLLHMQAGPERFEHVVNKRQR